MRLKGRVALVTGAGQGIGRAIALGLAAEGADLILNDIKSDTIREVCKEINVMGRKALPIVADVSSKEEVQKMFEDGIKEFKIIDILVNNAGIIGTTPVIDMEQSEWDRVFEVNARGTFLCCQAYIRHALPRRSGKIINIASIGGKAGAPGQAHYCATKAAVIAFTRILAMEIGRQGIQVNAVCPGIILTEMGKANLRTEESRKKWVDATTLGRLGEPEDVVGLIKFLASSDSDYITGQAINVCGGIIFH